MEVEIGKKIQDINRFTESDIKKYSEISGDKNPLHIDESFAKRSMFGERIVHGMLVASTISKLLGTVYPGPGTIYLSQSLKFLGPVRLGEKFTTNIELIEIIENKDKNKTPRLRFRTWCTKEDEVILEGEAVVIKKNPNLIV
jgi:3-hydroxybutyryl-CoA dehydratase